ncbi:unnamed protein product, partial [Iphiclides podalirius]
MLVDKKLEFNLAVTKVDNAARKNGKQAPVSELKKTSDVQPSPSPRTKATVTVSSEAARHLVLTIPAPA